MEIKVLPSLFLEQIYSIQHVSICFIYSYLEWYSNTLATWCIKLTHWKRPWCWERLKAGGERDDRGGGGWRASPTQQTWVWANSRRWWRTVKPSVLQSMGLQRIGHDWATAQEYGMILETAAYFSKPFKTVAQLFLPHSWSSYLHLSPLLCPRPNKLPAMSLDI